MRPANYNREDLQKDHKNIRIPRWYRLYGIKYMVYGIWYIDIRILETTICGIPLVLGLRTSMYDPCVHAVFWAPTST